MGVPPDVFREQPERERDNYKRALDEIARGVPKEDEWDSAADFMKHVAAVLDRYEIERERPRPRHVRGTAPRFPGWIS